MKEFIRYFNVSTKSCIPIPTHVIPYWELTFVLKGNLIYTIDGTEYTVEKDDVLLVPSGSHRIRQPGTCADYISFNFRIDPSIALPRDVLYKKTLIREIKSIVAMFPIKRLKDEPFLYSMDYEREKAANLLNYILFELLSVLKFQKNSPHVKKAIGFISEHLFDPISLTDISRHIALSKEYTAALFKKELGKTVTEYINERKMLYAKEVIQSGNVSLSQLAEKLGYENYGYFSRVFKKCYRVSPSHYRSEIKKFSLN